MEAARPYQARPADLVEAERKALMAAFGIEKEQPTERKEISD